MKIVLGTNTFNTYKRQDIAIDSWLHLRDLHDISLYDIQFIDEKRKFEKVYDLNTLHTLEHSSYNYCKAPSKKLPLVNHIIEAISNIDCDYFIFTNSDVIINSNLIRFIQEERPTCFACSRLDIQEIDSFQEVLDKKITPVRYEIAGFDTFVFKRDWYIQYKDLFRGYFLGKPLWDPIYATIMKIYGDNDPFGNNYPPFCFHIHHGLNAVIEECPEKTFNENSKQSSPLDLLLGKIFDIYLKVHIIKRRPWGAFISPIANEKSIEHDFFSKFIV